MNQILATHNNPTNNKRPIDTKKIIVFFCIAIIIFGIVAIAVAGYNLYKNNKDKEKTKEVGEPEIILEEIDQSIRILAKYENGISVIRYSWNENEPEEKKIYGKDKYEILIDIIEIEGDNVLKVEIIGEDGRKSGVTQTFTFTPVDVPIIDNNSPIIQWVVKNNYDKITIVVTDETELKNMKYKWDNGQEIIVEPTEENKEKIETTIDIARGKHELVITAEDKDGNISTKSSTFKGVKLPEISAIRYDDVVELTISHDMGLKRIEFIVNDQIYIYDENYSGYSAANKELLYKVKLKEGENVIQVTAESLEKINETTEEFTKQVYKGKCVYTPPIDTNE